MKWRQREEEEGGKCIISPFANSRPNKSRQLFSDLTHSKASASREESMPGRGQQDFFPSFCYSTSGQEEEAWAWPCPR